MVSLEYRIDCIVIHFDPHNSMTSCNVFHYRLNEQTAFHEKLLLIHVIQIFILRSTLESCCGRLLCQLLQKEDTLHIGLVQLIYVLFYMEFQFIIIILMLILKFSISLKGVYRSNGLKIVDVSVAFSLSKFYQLTLYRVFSQ